MSESRDPVDKQRLTAALPQHVAIIMDGNGRWAERQGLPRFMGHKAGVEAVRKVVRACTESGVGVLTLFAFSSENWRRPEKEVGLLMDLFVMALQREVRKLHDNGVSIRFIGDRGAFSGKLRGLMAQAEDMTRDNPGLKLNIAANYGGRWDITRAARRLARQVAEGRLEVADIDESALAAELSLSDLPEPDLFIRTGGEQRVSNFLLWQLAYTELYFTDVLWPDFDGEALALALASYAGRQRRFGLTGTQVEALKEGGNA